MICNHHQFLITEEVIDQIDLRVYV